MNVIIALSQKNFSTIYNPFKNSTLAQTKFKNNEIKLEKG